jgi:signal transduction histidine kinase
MNLLVNAIDATETLGEKWVKIDLADKGDQIELSITDSGSGIPKEVQDKMMQPFFTTKAVGSGMGLGLSISNGIIESHQGKLFLDTTSPRTRFVFLIPKVQGELAKTA